MNCSKFNLNPADWTRFVPSVFSQLSDINVVLNGTMAAVKNIKIEYFKILLVEMITFTYNKWLQKWQLLR